MDPNDTVKVTIRITADGRVSTEPPFRPSPLLPDLPALLHYLADTIVPEEFAAEPAPVTHEDVIAAAKRLNEQTYARIAARRAQGVDPLGPPDPAGAELPEDDLCPQCRGQGGHHKLDCSERFGHGARLSMNLPEAQP